MEPHGWQIAFVGIENFFLFNTALSVAAFIVAYLFRHAKPSHASLDCAAQIMWRRWLRSPCPHRYCIPGQPPAEIIHRLRERVAADRSSAPARACRQQILGARLKFSQQLDHYIGGERNQWD